MTTICTCPDPDPRDCLMERNGLTYRTMRFDDRCMCECHDEYDPTPYCNICGTKAACTCPPHPEND